MDYHKLKQKWAADALRRKQTSHKLKSRLMSVGVPIMKQFGIGKAILFGSVQTDRCEDYSDIDLLISPLTAKKYWAFRHELEQAMNFPVDVYTQDDDPVFIRKMSERGEVIYEI
jgi:predicted nucleotidyltransferase